MRRFFGACITAFVAVAATAGARADAPRIVLAATSEADPLAILLYEELGVLDMDVEALPAGSGVRALQARREDGGADAAVLVDAEHTEVHVWIGDASEAERLRDEDPALLALATVELLRGRLAGVPADAPTGDSHEQPPEERADDTGAPVATPGRSASVDATPRVIDEPAPTVALRLGPGALFGAGDLPLQVGVMLGVAFRLIEGLYLEITVMPAFPGAEVGQTGDPYSLWTGVAGAEVGWIWLDPGGPFSVHTGAGLGAALVTFDDGRKTEVRSAALPYLHGGARHRLVGPLGARIDVTLGVALPRIELKLRGGERPVFGQPIATVSLGVDLLL